MIELPIEVYENPDKAAKASAGLIAEHARAAITARARCVIAISGGRTPWAMLQTLGAIDLPWSSIHVVQVDERAAPYEHPDRNLTSIRKNLARSSLPPKQIHAMPVEDPDLAAAAFRYQAALCALAGTPPVLDVVQLGLGADGHIASLTPDSPALEVTHADVAVAGPYQGWQRMTLTYPILNRARFILFLVTGAEKAAALARLQARDPSIPAGRLRANRGIVIADAAAAHDSPPPSGGR